MTAAPTPEEFIARQPTEDLGAIDDPVAAEDAVMTRSEERLHVTTKRVATSRVRLRKQIVTEMQTITVPVSREEIVIDREPITDADGASGSLPDRAEQSVEIILYAERPVVTMETVAVERIRVSTNTVTEDQTITERVGKEQIELHEDPLEPAPLADSMHVDGYDTRSAPAPMQDHAAASPPGHTDPPENDNAHDSDSSTEQAAGGGPSANR